MLGRFRQRWKGDGTSQLPQMSHFLQRFPARAAVFADPVIGCREFGSGKVSNLGMVVYAETSLTSAH
jgi:hypothetical protein